MSVSTDPAAARAVSPSVSIALPAREGETEASPEAGANPKHRHLCGGPDEHEKWNLRARGESPLKRADRAYGEILQEVRVAQTAVQILLAFLLTLAFTSKFSTISHFQRDMYVLTLLLGAVAMALLIAPTAAHRVVYRRRLKLHLVRVAHRLALAGLAVLMLTMGAALLLILDIVAGMHSAIFLAGGVVAWFAVWWFAFPTWMRIRHRYCASAEDPPDESLPS